MTQPSLIVFAGRPGVGKTTLARELASQLGAVFLRIDTIEAGLMRAFNAPDDIADAGYAVARALAGDALALGQSVVADAVHARQEERLAWHDAQPGIAPRWVHVTCVDASVHQGRIDARLKAGAVRGADWSEISTRRFDACEGEWATIDTSLDKPSDCLLKLVQRLQLPTR